MSQKLNIPLRSGLSSYRNHVSDMLSKIINRSSHLTDEQWLNMYRNYMYNWVRFENEYFPSDYQLLVDVIKYQLDKED